MLLRSIPKSRSMVDEEIQRLSAVLKGLGINEEASEAVDPENSEKSEKSEGSLKAKPRGGVSGPTHGLAESGNESLNIGILLSIKTGRAACIIFLSICGTPRTPILPYCKP